MFSYSLARHCDIFYAMGSLRTLLVVIFISGVFLCLAPVYGESFFQNTELSLRGSILAIFEDNELLSDPMPILAVPGCALAYPFYPFLSLEASLDLYGTYYGYSYVLDRPVPYALENRSSLVMGSVLGIQGLFSVSLPLPKDPMLRFYAGPAMDLRICLIAGGLEGEDLEDATNQTQDITEYFWSQGRWLFFTAGIGADFLLLDELRLGLDFRGWVAPYHLWTGEELPTMEGLRMAIGLRATFL